MLTASPARKSVSVVNTFAFFCVSLLLATVAVFDAQGQVVVHGTDAPPRAAQPAKQDDRIATIKSRVQSGALPPSRLHTFIAADEQATRRLSGLTKEMMKGEDHGFAKRTTIGLVRELPVAVRRAEEMKGFVVGTDAVRVLKVQAEGALGLRLRFENVALPADARLFVYSATNQDDVHVFRGRGASDTGEFWTPPVKGDAIIVEYVAPETTTPQTTTAEAALPFVINQVSHIYKDVWAEDFVDRAAPCHKDIPEEWSATARSTGLMQFVTRGFEATCTGTLLNARNNDLTPYFLTAHHCVSTEAEAQSVTVRWFFDNSTAGYVATSGATLLSTGAATDYTVLMLRGKLPSNLRWAGWTSATPAISTAVTGIHHPAGDYKRIHFGNLINATCPPNFPLACSNVHTMRFSSGMGEPGTSGSGLWTGTPADPLLIGQNFGGDATCSNPQGVAWYGRFDLTYPNIATLLEGGSDDDYESNDARTDARAIGAGTFNNLVVKSTDEDWYRVTIPASELISVSIPHNESHGDVRIQMFRSDSTTPLLDEASSGGNSLGFTDMNDTAGSLDYFVRVYLDNNTRNNYNMIVTRTACTFRLSQTSENFSSSAGNRSLYLNATDGRCKWNVSSNASWLRYTGNAVPPMEARPVIYGVDYTFDANPNPSPRTGVLTIAGQTFTVTQQAFECRYALTPLTRSFSQSGGTGRVDADYSTSSENCPVPSATSNTSWITITSASSSFSTDGTRLGTFTYSVSPNDSPLPRTGTLTVANQMVSVTQAGVDPQWQPVALSADQVQFKHWLIRYDRNFVYAKLILPSAGYRIADWGQVLKTGRNSFTVDVKVERFTGTALPTQTTSAQIYALGALTPTEDFTFNFGADVNTALKFSFKVMFDPPPANPLDDARQFTRQQYLDFLGREPDAPGLDFWTREVTVCGADAACIDRKRVNTSGAFFLSEEFQGTGYYVYRLYKGALGRQPYYSEFMPDVARVAEGIVVNDRLSADVINRNKERLAQEFVTRAEFRGIYGNLADEAYVDRLTQTTGIELNATERSALLEELKTGAGTTDERRARVLARILDGVRAVPPAGGGVSVDQVFETRYGKAFYDREYNPAFVQMQYFGYLRRDPDQAGYNFWLNKLNSFRNFIDAEMVRSFILAPEYRARFGQP